MLCFPRYWKPICSLRAADKFIGYIHSQHPLMMNHQLYTVVVALCAADFHRTPVMYHRIFSYHTRHHCLFYWAPPYTSLCWCVMVWKCQSSVVFCSSNQSTLREAFKVTRIQWLTKIDSACSYEAFNSRVPQRKEECLNLSGRIERQRELDCKALPWNQWGVIEV